MKYRIDFVVHWLWTLTYAILAFSGVAMIGAKYGWVMNYNITLADYLHRTTAALWTILFLVAVVVEIYQRITGQKKYSLWLIVGPKDFQLFTLFSSLVFLITGLYIWVGHGHEIAGFTFNLWLHEVFTYLGLGSVIWHLYDKSHSLLLD